MDPDKRREIASKGGQASGGRPENLAGVDRREAGRKGGEAVSQDRGHMAEIGRKGGEAVSQDREHMAEIGRKGGGQRGGAGGGTGGSTSGGTGSTGGTGGKSGGRGFAGMDPERQREVASEGGRASHGGRGTEEE